METRSGVPWNIVNGTALAGSDFTANPATLIFNETENDLEKEIVITILDDMNDEDDQTFSVQLNTVSGVTQLNNGTGTITHYR